MGLMLEDGEIKAWPMDYINSTAQIKERGCF